MVGVRFAWEVKENTLALKGRFTKTRKLSTQQYNNQNMDDTANDHCYSEECFTGQFLNVSVYPFSSRILLRYVLIHNP